MEQDDLDDKLFELDERIVEILTPKDDADERGVVLEVRAGTGVNNTSNCLPTQKIIRQYVCVLNPVGSFHLIKILFQMNTICLFTS